MTNCKLKENPTVEDLLEFALCYIAEPLKNMSIIDKEFDLLRKELK